MKLNESVNPILYTLSNVFLNIFVISFSIKFIFNSPFFNLIIQHFKAKKSSIFTQLLLIKCSNYAQVLLIIFTIIYWRAIFKLKGGVLCLIT